MYHVSSKRHVIMIHHRSQVFVFKPRPWRADISLNTPHLSLNLVSCLKKIPAVSSIFAAAQFTGYCWFNDITSDEGGLPEDPEPRPSVTVFCVKSIELPAAGAGPTAPLLHHRHERSSSKH